MNCTFLRYSLVILATLFIYSMTNGKETFRENRNKQAVVPASEYCLKKATHRKLAESTESQIISGKKTLRVFVALKHPGIDYAMKELSGSLQCLGFSVQPSETGKADISLFTLSSVSEWQKMEISAGTLNFTLKAEGFSIRKDKRGRIWVAGMDTAGLMYGILELAEQIRLNGYDGVRNTDKNPYMEKRGIKFNIPLDVRTPSYSDMSDAGQVNIPEMWNFSFWEKTIDLLAKNRFNLISLWSLHPFPSMVRVPDYPEIALDDVLRSKARFSENYSTRATDICSPEITANTETVLRISMDEKIKFWRKVMRYAAVRNIRFMMMTWNIYPFGTDSKYGITDDIDNKTTRDYYRKSVKQMFLTYPDLAGIGVTTGENMGKGSEGFEMKEDWVYDTYARGILDVLKEQPDRRITFVHRQHEAGTKYILEKFAPLADNKNIEFLFSFKYAQAHVFSSVKQSYHLSFVKEIEGRKTLWTLRNDDNFYFRWGAPAFVRQFIKNIPIDVSAGFYYGSDNYIWGKDFLSLHPDAPYQTETERQWYQWLLWGRLGYDPDIPDERFTAILGDRFQCRDPKILFDAWQHASMIYPVTTGFHWGDLDYKWYIEGCKSRPEPALTESGFHDVNRFITLPPHAQSGYQSIPDYISPGSGGKSSGLISPPEVARLLHNHADSALTLAEKMGAHDNPPLANTVNDIRSMAYLGKYYACKIEGATSLALFRKKKDKSFQDKGVVQLTEALKYWNLYRESAMSQYRNPLWTNRVGTVDWSKLTGEVRKDIEICRKGFPDSVALENDYVRVMRNSAGCATANTPGFGTRIIVALTGITIGSSRGPVARERGGVAVFRKNESYNVSTGEYFEVAVKLNHPSASMPETWIEPVKNTIVYEDEEFRVFEERLAPGDTRELHSHAQRVVVRLNNVQLTDPRTRPEGSPGGGIQVPNTVKFAEPVVHVVRNLSKTTPLFNIVIEFKTNKN